MRQRWFWSVAIICVELLTSSATAAARGRTLGSRGVSLRSIGGGAVATGLVWGGGQAPVAPPTGLIWQNVVPPPPAGRLSIWNWFASLAR